ncbi:MAG: hypothetical protein WCE30_07900 [Mycobacterium sp.]
MRLYVASLNLFTVGHAPAWSAVAACCSAVAAIAGFVVARRGYAIQRLNRERAAHLALYDLYARLTTGQIAKARHELYITHLQQDRTKYADPNCVENYFILLWSLPFIVEAITVNDMWDKAKGLIDYHATMIDQTVRRVMDARRLSSAPVVEQLAAPNAEDQYEAAYNELAERGWFKNNLALKLPRRPEKQEPVTDGAGGGDPQFPVAEPLGWEGMGAIEGS